MSGAGAPFQQEYSSDFDSRNSEERRFLLPRYHSTNPPPSSTFHHQDFEDPTPFDNSRYHPSSTPSFSSGTDGGLPRRVAAPLHHHNPSGESRVTGSQPLHEELLAAYRKINTLNTENAQLRAQLAAKKPDGATSTSEFSFQIEVTDSAIPPEDVGLGHYWTKEMATGGPGSLNASHPALYALPQWRNGDGLSKSHRKIYGQSLDKIKGRMRADFEGNKPTQAQLQQDYPKTFKRCMELAADGRLREWIQYSYCSWKAFEVVAGCLRAVTRKQKSKKGGSQAAAGEEDEEDEDDEDEEGSGDEEPSSGKGKASIKAARPTSTSFPGGSRNFLQAQPAASAAPSHPVPATAATATAASATGTSSYTGSQLPVSSARAKSLSATYFVRPGKCIPSGTSTSQISRAFTMLVPSESAAWTKIFRAIESSSLPATAPSDSGLGKVAADLAALAANPSQVLSRPWEDCGSRFGHQIINTRTIESALEVRFTDRQLVDVLSTLHDLVFHGYRHLDELTAFCAQTPPRTSSNKVLEMKSLEEFDELLMSDTAPLQFLEGIFDRLLPILQKALSVNVVVSGPTVASSTKGAKRSKNSQKGLATETSGASDGSDSDPDPEAAAPKKARVSKEVVAPRTIDVDGELSDWRTLTRARRIATPKPLLVGWCTAKGLATNGKKDNLVDRLVSLPLMTFSAAQC
ncbi:hypothetical protein RQP46_010398 [Phenoliferia psychrophenolica]